MKKRTLSFLLMLLGISAFLLPGVAFAQTDPTLAVYAWTDKSAYLVGEAVTLRWTARGNADTNQYSVVIYRQNNQTGAKTYFNWLGQQSTTAMDISSRVPDQGFLSFLAGDATKNVVIGSGGWLAPSFSAPAELGMHTFVIEFRDSTGTRILKSVYAKFGVVSAFETVSGSITSNRTFVNTIGYRLSGVVLVTGSATLTIEPGTHIFGLPGSQPPSMLLIGVNGRINAQGTRSRPIIMTSNQPVGTRAAGDWGGLVLLGRAPVNVTGGTSNIEGLTPSADTTYGGTDSAHNCGTLAYVRVEFGGSILSTNNEINNITFGGCGSATVAHHLQSRYGLDDMFEWFGGTSDAKYIAAQTGRDDYIDGQLGWSGRIQHAIMVQGTDVQGNRGIEMDNSEFNDRATPQGLPRLYNVTFVGNGNTATAGFDESDSAAVYLRRGAGGAYNNMVLFNWITTGISVRNNSGSTATTDSISSNNLTMDGILMFDNGKASSRTNDLAGQAADVGTNVNTVARSFLGGSLGTSRSIVIADPLMRRPLFYSDPNFMPRAGSPIFRANWIQPPDDGFFDQSARWSGAFGDVDWTEEWTTWIQESDIRP